MKFSTLSAAAVSCLSILPSIFAIPVESTRSSNSVQKRSYIPSAPYWVAYWDAWLSGENGPPDPSELYGFNVLILSFLLASGSADQVTEWEELTAAEQQSIHSEYNAAGISLMVSAFGSTDTPTSSGYDAATLGQSMAQFVLDNNLDGIDVDYEDFDAINGGTGSAESWLVTFTQTLRSSLPEGQYIVTHAPVAPWFAQALYPAGAYYKVNQEVGDIIDWYNVQFYNQGATEYTTCSGLLIESSSTWPDTAVFQINSVQGVTLDKIVIGKPGTTSDATNGYVDPGTLAGCVQEAQSDGWDAGVMVWEFPDVGSAWIASVRADSWPVGGGSPTTTVAPQSTPATTTTTTAPATTTTASSGGSCAGVAAWNSQTAYEGGSEVTYDGDLWTAKWWSEADEPGGAAGDWTDDGPC